MSWTPLARFSDARIPKLFGLRRAARAGLTVPATVWARARDLDLARALPPEDFGAPWIVRSASPTEDTASGTAAGRFVSKEVEQEDLDGFRAALAAVVGSLPRDAAGRPAGAVFVQPLLEPERGGVLFFDGFAYECTTAAGGNRVLTSGLERGEVVRGDLERSGALSDWLRRVARCYARELESGAALDVEFARDGDAFTVLQARPAGFPVRRDPLLSLANHREILGETPSPWVLSALERAGADALCYFAEVDPKVGTWGERYSVSLCGQAWLNFSFFFRLMDHWGLPRTFVTEGVGGDGAGPGDGRADLARMVVKSPRLIRLQLKNLWTVARAERDLAAFGERIRAAEGLSGLFEATVFGLGVALRTNFAINGALTGLIRVRRALGVRGRARVTTEDMMEAYDDLRALAPAERARGLDAWLEAYGHRGPLESDPARPRFAELRGALLADLERGVEAAPAAAPRSRPSRGPLFALDRRREWFRDELMRRWQELRRRVLDCARAEGFEDVSAAFLLCGEDFEAGTRPDLEARRAEQARLARIELPNTARRSRIEAAAEGALEAPARGAQDVFQGISLGTQDFEGRVRRADELVALLDAERRAGRALVDAGTVLVVPALEPSWAVVFGRVGAVVTELGGELSHASILLREAGKPAVVNCKGVCAGLGDGERVRLDARRGRVERVASGDTAERAPAQGVVAS